MKAFKILYSQPDNPLQVTQEMCDRVSNGLKEKMGEYEKFVLPEGDMMSDVHVFRLDYLNSALESIKQCKGYSKHIEEYKNNAESTFFVTVLADVLVGHGLIVELEPDIQGNNKKPDLYAFQEPNGLGVYFECKKPNDDTRHLLAEQRKIFDGIEDVVSDKYSLALFYDKELSSDDINKLRDLIKRSLQNDDNIYENRCIVDDSSLGVKLCISGTSDNIQRNSLIEMSCIPNYSDDKGYSNVNGINRYGKNIVFLKSDSRNTIDNLLKNSRNKVPDGSPYLVCLDLSGPRFDFKEYAEYIANHFDCGVYTNFSGVLLVNHGLLYDGRYNVQLDLVENRNATFPLTFLRKFFYQSIVIDIESRYKSF